MLPEKIRYLLSRYQTGQLSEEEELEWVDLLQNADYENIIQDELMQSLQEPASQPFSAGDTDWSSVLQRVLSVDKTLGGPHGKALRDTSEDGQTENPSRRKGLLRSLPSHRWRWSAAAILLLTLSGSVLLLSRQKPKPLATLPTSPAGNIVPGSNRAILTLSSGQQVVLNSAANGVLSQQGNVQVIKLDSGQLAYKTGAGSEQPSSNESAYNTITTPRGGQYQVVLPDQTKVWLNAASALRFPTSFRGKERTVELSGEAYFEVAPNKEQPFRVKAGQTETLVLGTHFNIMAYGDENAIRTTLLEGLVKMGQGNQNALLRPGQQGEFDVLHAGLTTKEVNTRAAIAWKEGYYYFDRTPVQNVMRQIARWYNVEIVYQGAIPHDEIVGKIPRTAYVSEVLHIMELIGIHFKIEDRKIIVLS